MLQGMESYRNPTPRNNPSDRRFEKKENNFSRSIAVDASMKNNLGQILDDWWNVSCQEAKTSANKGELYKLEDVLAKLAKNVLDYGNGDGKITVSFEKEKIIFMVEDAGSGFDQPVETINVSIAGVYGLGEVLKFVDLFVLETKGKRYEKIGTKIMQAGVSDVSSGSRITCEKNILGAKEN